jgi:hypothetical protein
MIEKQISCHWQVRNTFDEPMKIASGYEPESYVHPEIVKFAEEIVPDERCCYAHVIFMADGNHYGTNMNGDWFDASEMTGKQAESEAAKNKGDLKGISIPRYKTFEQAKFFKHHDNGEWSPFFGDIPLAVWNDVMKRVEGIVRIFRRTMKEIPGSCADPQLAMQVDSGGFFTVSMGCRIHHEQCMLCGNENEFVSQRCDCLRNHMNEIMPDGRLVGARNFGMRFFDLSKVTIPAEPIAFSMGKVASYDEMKSLLPPLMRNSAIDIEEDALVKLGWRRKWAEMEKQVDSGNCTTLSDIPAEAQPMTEDHPVEFDPSELQQLLEDCGGDIDQAISTLTALGIVLSPTELAQLSHNAAPANSSFDDPDFAAPQPISLDKFGHAAYHSLKSKLAERSGFLATCPSSGWEPIKLAALGEAAAEMADYYSYYRLLLRSLPIGGFIKAAYGNSAVRELLGETPDHSRVQAAMHYLANAGLTTA